MKKKTILALFCLLFLAKINAQVYNGTLTLTTQSEVDAFNYTSVTGILSIDDLVDGNITNLNGLSELTSVGENLNIVDNGGLISINGLSNLGSIGKALNISDNDALINIDGLSGLSSVGGFLVIESNNALMNINGLSSLTNYGGSLISISNNSALENIGGLSGLTTIEGDLAIQNNSALTNINGLSNLNIIEGDFIFLNNDAINSLDGLSNLNSVGVLLSISGNDALTGISLSNLTSVGALYIQDNASLTNIDGLSNLASVGTVVNGHLSIYNNDVLADIDGLSGLSFIGYDLIITSNNALINIDGLSNVSSIGGQLFMQSNQSLTNIDGLSGINSIGGVLVIQAHSSLININGLSNLSSVTGHFSLSSNAVLTDIAGLSNLSFVGGDFDILGNTSLSEFCSLYTLFSSGNIGGITTVSGNAVNPTEQQILDGGPCTSSNQPPLAICQNITVSANANCQAKVTAEQVNNGSSDPDGDNITLSLSPAGPYSLGDTEVTLTVSDGQETTSCTAIITVVDSTAPAITATSQPIVLSPPNLQFETIDVSECVVSVSDNCSDISLDDVSIVSVSSDEKAGLTTDIIIAQNCKSVKLRRERYGLLPLPLLYGNGRVYTITLAVPDGNGNTAMATCKVTVPFGNKPVVDDGAAYTVNSSCLPAGQAGENDLTKTKREENSISIIKQVPEGFKLDQNYPNPFNQNTVIRWQLPVSSHVSLKVYDIRGNEVATLVDGNRNAGHYETKFDGSRLAGGMYICRLIAGNYVSTKKMLLIK